MRWSVIGALTIAVALPCTAARQRAVRGPQPKPPVIQAELPGCILAYTTPQTCVDGSIGNNAPAPAFGALTDAEVRAIVGAAASALDSNTATIGVVDRTGRPLALFRQFGANPANDDLALGVARTTAFFSNSQAPLSSRTIRFIAQVHFPPGLVNTNSGALYGIEQSNLGCDLNVQWNMTPSPAPSTLTTQCVVRARSIDAFIQNRDGTGDPLCNSLDSTGCGKGLVTGKLSAPVDTPIDDSPYPQELGNRPLSAGGIPLYRLVPPGLDRIGEGVASNGRLVGAIGVYGIAGPPELDEFAAVTGAFGAPGIIPLPAYPLPEPQNVFIDGIRLPFIGARQKLRFNSDGLPIGLEQPAGTSPGLAPAAALAAGTFRYGPYFGGCPPNGYLAGPYAGTKLTAAEVDAVIQRAVSAAKRTRSGVRLPASSYARVVISVVDVDGALLGHYRMPEALFDAVDVVPAKARNMVYFNGSDPRARADLPGVPAGTFVTTRSIGFGSQPLFPPGIDSTVFNVGEGPWHSTLYKGNVSRPCSQGTQLANPNQNGITFFAGATPLVRNGELVGGLGVSGDGIEQDDYVTFLGAGDLLPPRDRWADQIKIGGARLPMYKFPRQPEGVTECGGGPCD